jgi:hypothetical protein
MTNPPGETPRRDDPATPPGETPSGWADPAASPVPARDPAPDPAAEDPSAPSQPPYGQPAPPPASDPSALPQPPYGQPAPPPAGDPSALPQPPYGQPAPPYAQGYAEGYAQQPYPGYGQPGQGVPPAGYGYRGAAAQRPEPLAIVALVAAIVSVLAAPCCSVPGIVAGGLGLLFGFIARYRITRAGGALKGGGMALAGIITGAVGVVLCILSIVLIAALQANNMGTF